MFLFKNQIEMILFKIKDTSITSFQQENEDLFPTKRLLTQRIREIRQKLMGHLNQQQIQSESS